MNLKDPTEASTGTYEESFEPARLENLYHRLNVLMLRDAPDLRCKTGGPYSHLLVGNDDHEMKVTYETFSCGH
jgi:hypothetical protein